MQQKKRAPSKTYGVSITAQRSADGWHTITISTQGLPNPFGQLGRDAKSGKKPTDSN